MSAAGDPNPREGAVVEYVVGTMGGAERAAFARDLIHDATLAARVQAWEERLAPLTDRVRPQQPPTTLLPSILAAIGNPARQPADAGSGTILPWPVSDEVRRLRRSRSLWRGATAMAASLAAALAVYVAVGRLPSEGQELVAVVNRSGELPALIVRVDPKAGVVLVRSLAAETPVGHSLELWSIVGQEKPRSLGLVSAAASRAPIPGATRARLEGATIAVTVEPPGGTGDKGPTGPVVYSGKLIPELP